MTFQREVVKASLLKLFKTKLDKMLGNILKIPMIHWDQPCISRGRGTRQLQVISITHSYDSMVKECSGTGVENCKERHRRVYSAFVKKSNAGL